MLVQAKQLMEQHARGLCNLGKQFPPNSKRNYTADRYSRQTGAASSVHLPFLMLFFILMGEVTDKSVSSCTSGFF